MRSYFDYFLDKTRTELRTITFTDHTRQDAIPNGRFIFTEFFCTDLDCDCQRVLIKVLRADSDDVVPEEVATISYTWNEHAAETWLAALKDDPNPFLDPFHRQAGYAEEMLDFWVVMLKRDKPYSKRIERHYHELRAAHSRSAPSEGKIWTPAASPSNGSAKQTSPLTKREQRVRKRKLERAMRARKSR